MPWMVLAFGRQAFLAKLLNGWRDGPGNRSQGNGVWRDLPWQLLAVTLIGIWLMFTRLLFGNEDAMADSDHLVGALTFAITAMAEVARPLRFINMVFGAWLIIAPWILDGTGGKWAVVTVWCPAF